MKNNKLLLTIPLFLSFVLFACSCGKNIESIEEEEDNKITVGFSQVGAESDWRLANTESMKSVFTEENGYDFLMEDAQQKQANQITAVRSFIQQDVDYIVIAPVMESGWDTVLAEVKEAKIPVIIVDRMVDVSDSTTFGCWVGSDFALEGKKVTEWLHQYTEAKNIDAESINIVNIQGTLGSTSQIGRTEGLREAVRRYGWNLVGEVNGDYTAAKAYEEMARILKRRKDINVVYCENDNEAFGAIEAIEDSGLKCGLNIDAGEIMILSFDGVSQAALEDVIDGKIACIGECNPHHGPRVSAIIETINAGKNPDRYYYVDEQIFCADDTVKEVKIDGKTYPITIIDEEYLNNELVE